MFVCTCFYNLHIYIIIYLVIVKHERRSSPRTFGVRCCSKTMVIVPHLVNQQIFPCLLSLTVLGSRQEHFSWFLRNIILCPRPQKGRLQLFHHNWCDLKTPIRKGSLIGHPVHFCIFDQLIVSELRMGQLSQQKMSEWDSIGDHSERTLLPRILK